MRTAFSLLVLCACNPHELEPLDVDAGTPSALDGSPVALGELHDPRDLEVALDDERLEGLGELRDPSRDLSVVVRDDHGDLRDDVEVSLGDVVRFASDPLVFDAPGLPARLIVREPWREGPCVQTEVTTPTRLELVCARSITGSKEVTVNAVLSVAGVETVEHIADADLDVDTSALFGACADDRHRLEVHVRAEPKELGRGHAPGGRWITLAVLLHDAEGCGDHVVERKVVELLLEPEERTHYELTLSHGDATAKLLLELENVAAR
ncbi:MAG: hypothetical protein H6721_29075 [Sandaracinus sp.]|nr:hypothetical protein [Sandaracinus sp.]